MRILMSGGGTAGSVSPLLALYHGIKQQQPDAEFFFIGTRRAQPEMSLLRGYPIVYMSIYSGKLRRYFDWKNILDIFLILFGFFQSLVILKKIKPNVVVTAGGYVSVPVVWAAYFLKIKVLIHQQDIRLSLTNKLTKFFADKITVTFEQSLKDFPSAKTVWTGNPIRPEILQGNKERAYKKFTLKKKLPVLLVIGGGTGSQSINRMINQILSDLIRIAQIIHITGQGKRVGGTTYPHYRQYEFLAEMMPDALAVADLVVSRAGLSAITELSALAKAAILIPLPGTHQEDNANYCAKKGGVVVIEESHLSPHLLASEIKGLLRDEGRRDVLQSTIARLIKSDAGRAITEIIIKLGHGFDKI